MFVAHFHNAQTHTHAHANTDTETDIDTPQRDIMSNAWYRHEKTQTKIFISIASFIHPIHKSDVCIFVVHRTMYASNITDALKCLNSLMTNDVFIRKWQQLFHSIIDQILFGTKKTKHNGHYSIKQSSN